MANLGKLMKQFERAQMQMQRVQEELASKTVEGVSGGGAVKVVARCDQTIASVKISPEAVNPSDVAFLEELVLTATNNALQQTREVAGREMNTVTQGLNIPGLG